MTEQTIHKEQKGAGEIIGTSTSIGAAQRWILSNHITAAILSNFKRSLRLNQLRSNPKALEKKKIKKAKKLYKIATIEKEISHWSFVTNKSARTRPYI